jgi:hypothetical protein
MIKVSLVKGDNILHIWQEGGINWAAGTVVDALQSDKDYDKIIIDPKAEVPSLPFTKNSSE